MTVCRCRQLPVDVVVLVVVAVIVVDVGMAMTMRMLAMMMLVAVTMEVVSRLVLGLLPIGIDVESLLYDDDELVVFSIPSSDLLPFPDLMD